MNIAKAGLSAVGKLVAVGVLLGVFMFGMAGVVYMSLQGTEIKVPEITGKSFSESEAELTALGLKIKKRADRVTNDAPNTIIEQLPKSGETVKTGQLILVVTSKPPLNGEEAPQTIKKTDEDDSEKIEEMISDKPKKPKANANVVRKKADTSRDVNADNSNSNSNSNSNESNSNKKEPGTNHNSTEKGNKIISTPAVNKPAVTTTTKPNSGESRPRVSTRP